MKKDSKINILELRVDGGAVVNNNLMQFQSDILQAGVVRPKITETTALGAAYMAGLAVNYWSGLKEIRKQWQVDRKFVPKMNPNEIRALVKGWHRSVKAAEAWAGE
jgi:glycerol kinase